MSDRFVTKDFTLMNSNIEHTNSYVQKYRHFLVKFQYHRDLPKARTMHIAFCQEKVVRPTEKVEKFIWNFSFQLKVEDEMYKQL